MSTIGDRMSWGPGDPIPDPTLDEVLLRLGVQASPEGEQRAAVAARFESGDLLPREVRTLDRAGWLPTSDADESALARLLIAGWERRAAESLDVVVAVRDSARHRKVAVAAAALLVIAGVVLTVVIGGPSEPWLTLVTSFAAAVLVAWITEVFALRTLHLEELAAQETRRRLEVFVIDAEAARLRVEHSPTPDWAVVDELREELREIVAVSPTRLPIATPEEPAAA